MIVYAVIDTNLGALGRKRARMCLRVSEGSASLGLKKSPRLAALWGLVRVLHYFIINLSNSVMTPLNTFKSIKANKIAKILKKCVFIFLGRNVPLSNIFICNPVANLVYTVANPLCFQVMGNDYTDFIFGN